MFANTEDRADAQKPRLHIILPCYNPADGWEQNLLERFCHFRNMLDGVEVGLTIVNDGSARGVNNEKVDYLRASIRDLQWIGYHENKGKGYALRQGVKAADADFFIYTDIDFPYKPESMKAIFDTLVKGVDVAVGVRESDYYQDVPWRREIISKVLKKLIKLLLRIPLTDTQCGLKGFNRKGREVFLRTSIDRFLFDMEFVQLSFNETTLSVEPVIVSPRPDIVFSKMNYKVLIREMFNFAKLVNPLRKV